jgi:hypothetical protein
VPRSNHIIMLACNFNKKGKNAATQSMPQLGGSERSQQTPSTPHAFPSTFPLVYPIRSTHNSHTRRILVIGSDQNQYKKNERVAVSCWKILKLTEAIAYGHEFLQDIICPFFKKTFAYMYCSKSSEALYAHKLLPCYIYVMTP